MLKIEIGSGANPQKGYVHHDIRKLPEIDIICDARNFPVEEHNKYDEVYASNILEHFNRFDVKSVLAHWTGLAKIGGQIKIIVPDIGEIMRQYVEGHIDHEFMVYLVYGGQDYEYNRHYYGFDVESLNKLFVECDMEVTKVIPGILWKNRKLDKYCPMITMFGKRLR